MAEARPGSLGLCMSQRQGLWIDTILCAKRLWCWLVGHDIYEITPARAGDVCRFCRRCLKVWHKRRATGHESREYSDHDI